MQLELSLVRCSLSSYHFDMLRSSASAVGELGPASVPDLKFNSLKKHAVLCSELSNQSMNSEKKKKRLNFIPAATPSLTKLESATHLSAA